MPEQMSARFFTVSEANGQVAILAQHFSAVMQLRGQLKTLYRKLDDAGYPPDDDLDEDGSIDLDDDLDDDELADEDSDEFDGDEFGEAEPAAHQAGLEAERAAGSGAGDDDYGDGDSSDGDGGLLDEFEDVPKEVIRDHAVFRALVDTLRDRVTEIRTLGCVIKDLEVGLVDWPAQHQGREIWLCWKYGERDVGFWHGHDEGFAARQPVTDLEGGDSAHTDRRS